MNKFIGVLGLCLSLVIAQAQTVTVNKQNEKVKNETIEVFATTLEGRKEDIQQAFARYQKEMGKVKLLSSPAVITEPVISGTPFSKGIVYAGSQSSDKATTVWMGINSTEWDEKDVTYATRELQKMVYQFGIKFYRDQAQKQIDETQQALDAVEKQQQRMLNQSKDLTIKLSNNEQEKVQLEKSLENNKLENVALKIRIENNKKAQDSLANTTIQIKKVMETYKEKQRKIN
jgi:predicted RNase H-like nuclease (RuvC/YqgF family)